MPIAKILRKRFIPDETVDISSDKILYFDENLLITSWTPIRPRKDFSYGISYTFLKEGYKISRIMDDKKVLIFWYCDIIKAEYFEENKTYILTDYLIDIKITPVNNTVEVLDLGELAEALENNLITKDMSCYALKTADKLIKRIYEGEFPFKECLLFTS